MIAGRGKSRIRPPRRGLHSPADNEDFDSMWSVLASSLREIHTKNASQLSFEELYRSAYKIVLKKKGEALYNKVKEFEATWLSNDVRTRIRDLLSGNIITGDGAAPGTTPNERRIAGEKFLRGLKQAWEDHNLCMGMTTDVLMYMDRVYCTESRKPSIFIASMGLFRDFILRSPLDPNESGSAKVAHVLNSIILDQIQMEREGDIIDRNLIRSCVYMLEGLYETDKEEEWEKLYLTSFEQDFLDASRGFYKSEADKMLRDCDAITCLRRTSKRLEEENDRCRSTISPWTAPKITSVVEDELIRNRIREVIDMEGSGAHYMFDNDLYHDLQLLYELISRVDDKKEELCRALQMRVVQLGTDINQASSTSGVSSAVAQGEGEKRDGDTSKQQSSNPGNLQVTAAIKWVDDVLQLKDKYDVIWKQAFDSDQVVQASLTRAFAEFINLFNRSPEYISLFIDDNLKRGLKGKTEAEADEVLDKAIVLLRYIQDKDLFERYYKKHLSKRLLGGRSVSNDVERQMISKMKMEIGNHFTQKLEGMFKDMTISEELSAGFRTHVSQLDGDYLGGTDLAVNVLTTTFWPMETLGHSELEQGNRSACDFPPEIAKIKTSFEKFYLSKHVGRQLKWLANSGSADVRTVFPSVKGKDPSLSKERKYEINVSTYALVILLLFNDLPSGESLSFEDIQAKTLIPSSDLVRNLQSLAVAPKTRILVKEPMSKDVKPTDRFFFNEGFTSKLLKLKVGVVAGANKVEGDKERRETEKKNDEMRAGVIEAAIVRIMKGRKTLSHQNLCAEVMSQLASRFVPDVNMVKKRVESLIEREYLERVEDAERPAYRYLA